MADKQDHMYKSSNNFDENKGGGSFLWNPYTREFLGRTGCSWFKITVFYIVFYAALAGFWSIMLFIFYETLDYYKPTFTLTSSRIGNNPGLGFRPRPPKEHIDSTLIWIKHGSSGGYTYWVESLKQELKQYEGRQFGEFLDTCAFNIPKKKDRVCKFILENIDNNCSASQRFGYDLGHPCILIKINRIYGWEPQPYENGSYPAEMPENIKQNYDPNYVYISCAGENPADRENIGPIAYYPSQGIPKYYFPFTNTPGYVSPFVFVHFQQPETGVLINIECKAWAANIVHDRMDRLGSVHFELLVD